MTNNLFPNYEFGTCRVAGATGATVYVTNGIRGMAKSAPGVYVIDLGSGADPLEHQVTLGFVGDGGGALTWEHLFLSDLELEIRTFANGVLFDTDFEIEVNRIRTGPLTAPLPPPSPPPVPGPSGSGPWFDMDAIEPLPGADTVLVGGTSRDAAGNPLPNAKIQFNVYDDLTVTTLSPFATFGAAVEGTIDAALPAALEATTDALGRFSVALDNVFDMTNYLACGLKPGGPALDCSEIESVTFTP